MKLIKTPFVLTLVAAIAVTAAVVGCNKDKTPESEMSTVADKTADATKDAAAKTADATKDAAAATKDAVTNTMDKMK